MAGISRSKAPVAALSTSCPALAPPTPAPSPFDTHMQEAADMLGAGPTGAAEAGDDERLAGASGPLHLCLQLLHAEHALRVDARRCCRSLGQRCSRKAMSTMLQQKARGCSMCSMRRVGGQKAVQLGGGCGAFVRTGAGMKLARMATARALHAG